ncbi:MAG: PilZ domain-containing protein [Candidatus Eremiobacteraeota bacterium]|nr:PilZ domain-containing protein [Candidatus Eremiobacteraeota bacterium]
MLALLRRFFTPTVYVTGYLGNDLTFACGQSLAPGREHQVKASLPDGQALQMTITVVKRAADRYTAQVLYPPLAINALVRCFPPPPPQASGELHYKEAPGAFTTHVRTFAIRSKDLPNFKATSAELSLEGTRAVLDGPIEAGQELTIELEVDHSEMSSLKIRCKVAWCSQRDRTSHVAYLEFLDLDSQQTHELGGYLAGLKTGSAVAPEYRR